MWKHKQRRRPKPIERYGDDNKHETTRTVPLRCYPSMMISSLTKLFNDLTYVSVFAYRNRINQTSIHQPDMLTDGDDRNTLVFLSLLFLEGGITVALWLQSMESFIGAF